MRKLVHKNIQELKVGEGTFSYHSGRYVGVSIGRDRNGFFVFTHRARSHSYPIPSDVPDHELKWIRSTG